jgi:hypothetical protein
VEVPKVLTTDIQSIEDAWMRLGEAAFWNAVDEKDWDWLRSEGKAWLELLGLGELYEKIMERLNGK